RVKVYELRGKSYTDLFALLKDLKAEFALLRVAKVTGGAPNKLSKIDVAFQGYKMSLNVSQWVVMEKFCAGRSKIIHYHTDGNLCTMILNSWYSMMFALNEGAHLAHGLKAKGMSENDLLEHLMVILAFYDNSIKN
ncbi:60S ribosomal protein L35-like protein, partial [Tanacetum coccineum]